jgi:hypothetical protein
MTHDSSTHSVRIYGCHTLVRRSDPYETVIIVQHGLEDDTRLPVLKQHVTRWNNALCGHMDRHTDPSCDTCVMRFRDAAPAESTDPVQLELPL